MGAPGVRIYGRSQGFREATILQYVKPEFVARAIEAYTAHSLPR